jgi:hypothetical protein
MIICPKCRCSNIRLIDNKFKCIDCKFKSSNRAVFDNETHEWKDERIKYLQQFEDDVYGGE